MKKTCLLLLVLLVAIPSFAAQKVDTAAIDAVMTKALAVWHIPGASIAVVKNGEVVYLKGYGVRDISTKEPVTPDTLFALASMTKAFTSTAVGTLVDEKKMSWDDPVRKHLDYFHLSDPCADWQVTMRDIMSHRTGLGGHEELLFGAPFNREEAIRRIGRVSLDHSFRSGYEYQNQMFIAAGEAAAAAAHQSWEDLVRSRITGPLGMTRTKFSIADARATDDHAVGHSWKEDRTVSVFPWYDDTNVGPAGSMHSSARDLSRWLLLQLSDGAVDGKRILSAESLAETHMPQTVIRVENSSKENNPETNMMAYALGWFAQDYRGEYLVWHSGSLNGFRAMTTLLPDRSIGFVILTNLGRTPPRNAMRSNLVDLLTGKPKRDWNAYYLALETKRDDESAAKKKIAESIRKNAPPTHELSAYAGEYQHPAYGIATVTAQGNALRLSWTFMTLPLDHVHYDVFRAVSEADDIDEEVTFAMDANGDIASMRIFGETFARKR